MNDDNPINDSPVSEIAAARQLSAEAVQASIFAMLNTTNAGLTAQIALMLSVPVPATDIMNMLVEHVARLLSLVEPEQLRNSILAEIRRNLPVVLNRHVEARNTTSGGVFVPAGARIRPN
jgi:hypothetical protein